MLDSISPLVEAGFSVIWLKPRQKMPIEASWTSNPTYTLRELTKSYDDGNNAGVRLGKPSKVRGKYLHAVDMDIRKPDLVEKAKKQLKMLLELDLEEYPTVKSGSKGPSRHYYFLSDEPFASKKLWNTGEKFIGDDGKDHWTAELELLGTGKQVVLPPSIHPDTGLEYAWEAEFDAADLPIIDIDVLKAATGEDDYVENGDNSPLGLRLEEAKAALSHIQHWADDHETWRNVGMALKHEFGQDAWTVFDEWSRKGRGYSKGENRAQWRGFKNEKKRPVTMRTVMQASNDAMRAIDEDLLREEFAELIAEPREPKPLGKAAMIRMFEEDAGIIEKKIEKEGEVRGVPKHLLMVPGKLGLAVKHYNETSIQPQPQFAVQTALALGSVVLGRYWKTDVGNYSALYFVNLGRTGAGKEFCRRYLGRALKAAKFDRLLGASNFTSEAAVIGELIAYPRTIAVIDEFGKILGAQKMGQNGNAVETQAMLMSLFGLHADSVRPKAYSSNGKSSKQVAEEKSLMIERPSLSLVGLSTPETFFDALAQEDVASGFMNRLLVVNSRMPETAGRFNAWTDPPKDLTRWIRNFVLPEELGSFLHADFDREEGGNPYGEEIMRPPEAVVVPFTDGARRLIDELGELAIKEKADLYSARLDGLWVRAREIAMKISLIVACSMDRRDLRVERSDLQWAWDYVSFYTRELVENAMTNLSATPVVKVAQHFAAVIDENGRKGMSMRDMARQSSQFRTMTSRDKDEVIRQLLVAHNVEEIEIKPPNGGRVTKRYVTKEVADELHKKSSRRRDDED